MHALETQLQEKLRTERALRATLEAGYEILSANTLENTIRIFLKRVCTQVHGWCRLELAGAITHSHWSSQNQSKFEELEFEWALLDARFRSNPQNQSAPWKPTWKDWLNFAPIESQRALEDLGVLSVYRIQPKHQRWRSGSLWVATSRRYLTDNDLWILNELWKWFELALEIKSQDQNLNTQ